MTGRFILKGTKVVKCNDLMEWAKWMEKFQDRIIQQTTLDNGKWVSTVFLGINYNFGKGKPLLFETMVFPSNKNLDELQCIRYNTYKQAIKGHWQAAEAWSNK